ncbi:MAG: hypothetical protein ACRDDZ_08745 [Marinifilaceae bacterium]
MEVYINLRGNSPITHYYIEPNQITVWFNTGKCYVYSDFSAGKEHVEVMKDLARRGSGLSAYITRNVRYGYVR